MLRNYPHPRSPLLWRYVQYESSRLVISASATEPASTGPAAAKLAELAVLNSSLAAVAKAFTGGSNCTAGLMMSDQPRPRVGHSLTAVGGGLMLLFGGEAPSRIVHRLGEDFLAQDMQGRQDGFQWRDAFGGNFNGPRTLEPITGHSLHLEEREPAGGAQVPAGFNVDPSSGTHAQNSLMALAAARAIGHPLFLPALLKDGLHHSSFPMAVCI